MARDTKILQMLLDGQVSLKKEMRRGFEDVNKKIDNSEKRLTRRIDKLGLQLARLEDDAPTVKEFDDLARKVTKIQHHLALD